MFSAGPLVGFYARVHNNTTKMWYFSHSLHCEHNDIARVLMLPKCLLVAVKNGFQIRFITPERNLTLCSVLIHWLFTFPLPKKLSNSDHASVHYYTHLGNIIFTYFKYVIHVLAYHLHPTWQWARNLIALYINMQKWLVSLKEQCHSSSTRILNK